MPSITLTDVVAHTLIDAGVVNNNNAALRSTINGGLDNANISPSAGIVVTKLSLPGGTTNFLRADGSWATPPGTQGSPPAPPGAQSGWVRLGASVNIDTANLDVMSTGAALAAGTYFMIATLALDTRTGTDDHWVTAQIRGSVSGPVVNGEAPVFYRTGSNWRQEVITLPAIVNGGEVWTARARCDAASQALVSATTKSSGELYASTLIWVKLS